jgi:hypothetical protein
MLKRLIIWDKLGCISPLPLPFIQLESVILTNIQDPIMRIFRLLPIMILLALGLRAQAQENEAQPIENDIRISSGEKFDFIFTRGLLVPGANLPADTAPLYTSTSGSYSFGFGFGIPLKKAVAIRLEPRLTWHNLNFQQNANKTFPTDSGNVFVYERIRSFYAEMPLGLRFNLARNTEDKVRLFTEVGFSGGLLLSSAAKSRTGTGIDRVTVKRHDVWGMNRLRYGPYFRFGTNWIAFHAAYRMTPIFDENKRYLEPKSQTAAPFPKFPKLELGFSVML